MIKKGGKYTIHYGGEPTKVKVIRMENGYVWWRLRGLAGFILRFGDCHHEQVFKDKCYTK